MKTIKIHFLITLFTFVVLSCNSEKNKTNKIENKAVDKIANSEESNNINSPCELVSLEDIKNIFAVAEYSIETEDKTLTYSTCIYKWEDEKVFKLQKMADQEIKMVMPSEVLIVMIKKANENMFNQSTKVYKQPQIISNVGDMAIWDNRMSQLTFLSNQYMFHVHVKVTNDEIVNREKAIEVSNLIIKKIK
jgi:hypothetical protein